MVIAELCVKYLADIADLKGKVGELEKTNVQIAKSAQETSAQMKGLATTINGAANAFQTAVSAFASLGLLRISKEIAMTAGRADELQKVMYIVGKNLGYTTKDLDLTEASLKRLGIATNEARSSITRTMQANLDLAKAIGLARMAQDLAVISGWNSSETLERLIINIQQADTLGLRFMGIILSQDEAYQKYTTTMGIVGRELTRMERTQAVYNAVMEQGVKFTGSYEESLNSWTKTARTTERFVQELKIALGKGLQEPLLHVERALQNAMAFVTGLGTETTTTIGYMLGFTAVIATLGAALNILALLRQNVGFLGKEFGITTSAIMKTAGALYLLGSTAAGRDMMSGLASAAESVVKFLGEFVGELKGVSDELGTTVDMTNAFGDALQVGLVTKLMGASKGLAGFLAIAAGAWRILSDARAKAMTESTDVLKVEFPMPKTTEESDIQIAILKKRLAGTVELQHASFAFMTQQEKEQMVQRAGLTLDQIEHGYVKMDIDLIEGHSQALEEKIDSLKKTKKANEELLKSEKEAAEHEKALAGVGYMVKQKQSAVSLLSTKVAQKIAYDDLIADLTKLEAKAKVAGSPLAESYRWALREIQKSANDLPTMWEKIDKEIASDYEHSVAGKIIELNKKIATTIPLAASDPRKEEQLLKYKQDQKKLMEELVDLYTKSNAEASKLALEDVFGRQNETLEALRKELGGYTGDLSDLFSKYKSETDALQKYYLSDKIRDTIQAITDSYDNQFKTIQEGVKNITVATDFYVKTGESKINAFYEAQEKEIKNSVTDIQTRNRLIAALEEDRVRALSSLEQKSNTLKQTYYQDNLKAYKSMLDSMQEEHRRNVKTIENLEIERRNIIRETEQSILKVQQDTESEIRELQRSQLSPKEQREDLRQQVGQVFGQAQSAFGEGTEESLKKGLEYLNQAKSLSKGLSTELKGEKGETIVGKADAIAEATSWLRRFSDLQTSIIDKQKDLKIDKIDEQTRKLTELNSKFNDNLDTVKAGMKEIQDKLNAISLQKIELLVDTSQALKAVDILEKRIKALQAVAIGAGGRYTTGQPTTETPVITPAEESTIVKSKEGVYTNFSIGGIIHAALGKYLTGYGGGDRIPVMAEAGEYVHRKEAVSHYGVGFMEALNNMRIPQMPLVRSGGGSVNYDNRDINQSRSYVLHYSGGGSIAPSFTIKSLMKQISIELEREQRRS